MILKISSYLIFLSLASGCAQLEGLIGREVQEKVFSIRKLWVRNTLVRDHLGYRRPHRMSPLINGDVVIQGNAIDGIGSFNRKTGQQIWFKEILGGVEGGAGIEADSLYFGASDGFFYSLKLSDGSLNWKTPIQVEALSSPLVTEGVVYFIAGNNRVYALEASSGRIIWSYSRQEISNLSIRGGSQPALYKQNLLVGFSDGVLVSLEASTGKPKWERVLNTNKKFKDIDAKPVIEDDKLYVSSFDQGLYCLDPETGRTLWEHDQGGFSAVTIDSEQLFYSTTDGQVISLDKSSGKLNWRYVVPNSMATQPVIYKGLLVFGVYAGDVTVLDSQTGKIVGSFSTGRGVMSNPSLDKANGKLYFISVNANLFALQLDWRPKGDKWPWED